MCWAVAVKQTVCCRVSAYVYQAIVNPLQVCWACATAVETFLLGFSASYCPGQHPLSARLRVNNNTGSDTKRAQFNTIRGGWLGLGAMLWHLRRGLARHWGKWPLASPIRQLCLFYFSFLYFSLIALFTVQYPHYLLLLQPVNHMSHCFSHFSGWDFIYLSSISWTSWSFLDLFFLCPPHLHFHCPRPHFPSLFNIKIFTNIFVLFYLQISPMCFKRSLANPCFSLPEMKH